MSPFRLAMPAVLAAVILTAGCGQGAATLVPVATPTKAPVPHEGVEAAGRLEVRVSGLGDPIQATYLRVTVSGGQMRAPRSKEVMADSTGAIALESIPAGPVKVTVEALDADGARVGLEATTTTVLKGQTAVASADLALRAPRDVGYDAPGQVSPSAAPEAPTPTPTPEARLAGEPLVTWYADGTMGVEGVVTNYFATARTLRLKVEFSGRGLVGWKAVETKTASLGSVEPLGTRAFSIRSDKKISGLLADGKATVTVVAE
ncbi:MAG: hypothetical protein ACK46X_05560 [Candidatus Sericytochromatia bacterium]